MNDKTVSWEVVGAQRIHRFLTKGKVEHHNETVTVLAKWLNSESLTVEQSDMTQ